ncbi:MAG: geranylgeranylglycerol-phosphate geranylgeranyltransferase [Chitinispirillaceae bacterium]|nr:geranylgeranylglycerol-phosphate geranylgeranyltransferase [Chitinispirillaceae bacterium]
MHPLSYLKIIRPPNAAMAAGAVCLGAWISSARLPLWSISILAAVAVCAAGFGNVINDILDVGTDRISHPDRPLPSGTMGRTGAITYGALLALFALAGAFLVGPRFGIATLLPLMLLIIYAIRLKATPLAGNVIVSLLVAYALIFGSLGAPQFHHLFVPALLAMLLNFSREIIKDLQDDPGDRTAGIITSAALPFALLKRVLFICSGIYALLLFLPCLLGHFGTMYAVIVFTAVIPLHIRRLLLLLRPDWRDRVSTISLLLKIEMISGLLALAIDRCFTGTCP